MLVFLCAVLGGTLWKPIQFCVDAEFESLMSHNTRHVENATVNIIKAVWTSNATGNGCLSISWKGHRTLKDPSMMPTSRLSVPWRYFVSKCRSTRLKTISPQTAPQAKIMSCLAVSPSSIPFISFSGKAIRCS